MNEFEHLEDAQEPASCSSCGREGLIGPPLLLKIENRKRSIYLCQICTLRHAVATNDDQFVALQEFLESAVEEGL